jgi:mannose-6-phosphate isomerase-like protein (cupin superfamily)
MYERRPIAPSSSRPVRATAWGTSSSSPGPSTPPASRSRCEIAPGRELEPHVHADEDDAFCIVEGEMTFPFGEDRAATPPGTFALVPPGVEHGFRNDGDCPVRMLNIHAPAGFDRRIGLPD